MSDDTIEKAIQEKGLTAPRITKADIEANIRAEYFFTGVEGCLGHSAFHADGSTQIGDLDWDCDTALDYLTFCVLILKNGFTVTGESACASPENFDAEIGRQIARDNAINKVWPLMGYELKERLSK